MKLVFTFFFMCVLAFTQMTHFTVRSLAVEGNVRTDENTIRMNSGLYVGKKFLVSEINQAIKNLWALKQWKQIQIDVAAVNDNQEIDLVIKVEEYPRINTYKFKGNDELDDEDLDELISFYRGKIYTPYEVFKAVRKIKSKYTEEGYLLAEVQVDTTLIKGNRMDIVFNINEGAEVSIKRIRVVGNKTLEADDIVDAMEETSAAKIFGLWGGDFKEKDYKKDLGLLSEYIQNQGFRNGGFVKDSIYYSKNKKHMYIDIHVTEGQRFYFGHVKFQGNTKISDDEFMDNIEIKKGEPYSVKKFNEAKAKLSELYYNLGHLYSQQQPREILNGDTVNITYSITENNVVRIRAIDIEGNTKTQEKVIRRNIKIYPGQKFSQAAIKRAMDDINQLNYFSDLKPDVKQIQNNNDYIDLNFSVKEKSTDQANASIGYSEAQGLIGSIGLTFNNFSMQKPFKEGGGQTLGVNAQFGGYQNVYSLSFTEPYWNDTPTLIGGSFYYSQSRKDAKNIYGSTQRLLPFDQDRLSFRLTLGRHFKWPDPFFSGSVSAEYSSSRVTNLDDDFKSKNAYYASLEDKDVRTYTLSSVIQRNSRNNPQFPTNGSVYSLTNEFNVGDKSFLKTIFHNEVYTPAFGSLILYTGFKVGAVKRFGDNGGSINTYDLFQMGGTGMEYGTEALRGYASRTVYDSELGVDNYFLGGDAMFKFNTELRMQLVPNPTIFGLLFLEGGNVWKNVTDINVFDIRRSAGAGVRLFMPLVGIIGVDFGYGFDRFSDIFTSKASPKWEIHFQFGKF